MTEHNHRRGTRSTDAHKARWRGWRKRNRNSSRVTSELIPDGISAKWMGFPDGPNDAVKYNRGEKKYERTRFRFHEKAATKKLASEMV